MGRGDDGDLSAAPLGSLQDRELPTGLADDQIDGALSVRFEAHDAGQRIRGVSAADLDLDPRSSQIRPERRVEAAGIEGEEVLVRRRSGDSMGGQGGGADQGVLYLRLPQDGRDLVEEAQPMISVMHRE
jgi:hypothetical protein